MKVLDYANVERVFVNRLNHPNALQYFYNSSYIGIISNVLDNKFMAGIIETIWKLIERK